MDKLYDLMTMGFKHQMLLCAAPEELLHITRRHLHNLQRMIKKVCCHPKVNI